MAFQIAPSPARASESAVRDSKAALAALMRALDAEYRNPTAATRLAVRRAWEAVCISAGRD